MDLAFTDEQAMLKDSIEKFIINDYDFEVRQNNASGDPGFSPELWTLFAELGWTAVPFAEADGGFDGGPVELMVMMQQFGRGLVVEPFLANIVLAGGVLRRAADEAQKSRWLQPLIAGELQAALATGEPQSRYDLANVQTTAKKDDGGWTISGQKGVVLNGGNAELLLVPARTSGDSRDTEGITMFAVDASAEGVTRTSYPTVDGHRAAEISLDNVRVAADCVLCREGSDHSMLVSVVVLDTLALSADAVGILQVLNEKTVEYAKSR